jgi:hypothetical protein
MGKKGADGPAGRRRNLACFLIVLVPSLIVANRAGFWLANLALEGRADQTIPQPGPAIVADPETLDFKEAWETDTLRLAVIFQNVSDRPAFLHGIRPGCACTQVDEPGERLLSPGERTTVRLSIDLFKLRAHDPSEIRPVDLSIIALTGSPGQTHPSF